MDITTVQVRLRCTTPMLGAVPKNREVYASYIETERRKRVAVPGADGTELAEVEAETVDDMEARGWTGFHTDPEHGLFVYDYLVKGFLKEAGNVLKDTLKPAVKALRSKLDSYVFVRPRRIFLGRLEPAGVVERPLRAMTMQGPRVTLVRSDYVPEGTEIACQFLFLPHREITPVLVRELLEYGALKGLGQFRNGSYGQFAVVAYTTAS